MTALLKDAPVDDAAKIAAQNDAFRGSIMFFNDAEDTPKGQFVMTRGVMALGSDSRLAATRAVAAFQAFTPDNDPYGFHEFGAVEVLGTTVWFKIDGVDAPSHNGIAMCQTGFVGSQ